MGELLGLGGNGFNVMDFLDSVLDEPKRASTDDGAPPPAEEVGNNLPANLPSNPWGEKKSRAAAYGIAFEENAEESAGDGDIVHAMLSNAGLSEGSQNTPL